MTVRNYKLYITGMTLMEMIVVIGISTVLMLAISNGITDFYKVNAYTIQQAEETENARRGITQWNRDAKEITTGEDGSYPIATISEHEFAYYSDTDLDDSVEYVKYKLTGTTLYKYTYEATGVPAVYNLVTPSETKILSLFVQNINQATSTFYYYDNTGMALSSTSPVINVRYITAKIIVNIDSARYPGEFMLRSSIAPRNLKDNL